MRILLVDDHAALREALSALLATEPTVEVVGEAADGAECLRLAEATRPDLVLMDVRMPVVDGVEATRTLRQRYPDTRVIALTSFQDTQHVAGMIAAGASGYLLKTLSPSDLRAAIRAAAEGRPVMSPEVFERVLEDVAALYRTQEHRAEQLVSGARMRRELLTIVSDDLRNPLTAINGAAATLSREWDRLDDDTRRELLDTLGEQTRRLQQRVDEVITAVAVEPTTEGVFVLSDAVREGIGRLGEGAARLAVELDEVRARGDHPAGVRIAATLVEEAMRLGSGDILVRTSRGPSAGRVLLEVVSDKAPASGGEEPTSGGEESSGGDADHAARSPALEAIERLLHSVEGELEVDDTGGKVCCLAIFEEGTD